MMRVIRTFAALMIVYLLPLTAFAQTTIYREDLQSHFAKNDTVGTLVIYDAQKELTTIVNQKRAAERKIPASTFKIANSLIALEERFVRDEEQILPYGGGDHRVKAWEQDMSLRDAFQASNVPVFQGLARRIGVNNYLKWLRDLEYGNGRVGGDVENFWLNGPLKISAIEQTKFLARLAQEDLPLSRRAQATVSSIAKIHTRNRSRLFGKTGWTTTPTPNLGWFVGWVANDSGMYTFALNMDMQRREDAPKRQQIALDILEELGIY